MGYLCKLTHNEQENQRVVVVDFEEDHQWECLFDELERVNPKPLDLGENVWISRDIAEPIGGWAGVTPVSVGKVVNIIGESVQVDFPECTAWRGVQTELERSRRIIVGDHVKVCQFHFIICNHKGLI